MGHIRLGTLPNTHPWNAVVALIADGGTAAEVAEATANAAQKGLDRAHTDVGLCQVIFLLSKLVLASRERNFAEALNREGITDAQEPGIYDIIAGFTEAIDHKLLGGGQRSDIGEMAQLAAVESLSSLIGTKSSNLFGTTTTEIKAAAYKLSTKKGFSTLAHDFFSRFTQRFLTYHLGRVLSNHVGGNCRFASPTETSEFVSELGAHCRQASEIVRTFAGGWYSKHNFEGGITEAKAKRFADYAITKLKSELKVRGGNDV